MATRLNYFDWGFSDLRSSYEGGRQSNNLDFISGGEPQIHL